MTDGDRALETKNELEYSFVRFAPSVPVWLRSSLGNEGALANVAFPMVSGICCFPSPAYAGTLGRIASNDSLAVFALLMIWSPGIGTD